MSPSGALGVRQVSHALRLVADLRGVLREGRRRRAGALVADDDTAHVCVDVAG
ncbi:MAG: hypothetical protein ACXWBO_08305 [Ilumatobacteraceae bacterium]